MYEIAVGNLGISPDYFLDYMSVKAYNLASTGRYNKNKETWEQTRLISYHTIAPHLKKNTSITSFMPFEWDNETPELSEIPTDRKELFRDKKSHQLKKEPRNG